MAAVVSADDWPAGMEIVGSPYMPADTFIIGPVGGTRLWEAGVDDLRLLEPLWEPPRWPLAPVYVAERDRAHRFLEGLLDGLCEDYGIDAEVWRAPRRQLTHDAMLRRNRLIYALEERLGLTVVRPNDFMLVSTT